VRDISELFDLLPDPDRLTQFEAKVRQIADDLFTTGVKAVADNGPLNVVLQDKELSRKFYAACHDGYMTGQRQLVEQLLRVQSETSEAKARLKAARKARDKKGEARGKLLIASLAFEEKVLRRLADALVWVLCGDRRWLVKRFYTGQEPPQLASSNYESALRAAEHIHESDPLSFALLADLISIIQVGDLLVITRDHEGGAKLGLAELKEGALNEIVGDFVDFFIRVGCIRAAYFFREQYGEHAAEQAARMMRQAGRMAGVAQVVNTDKGTDMLTNKPIRLSADEIGYYDYDDELAELLEKASKDGSASVVIDGCLVLGVYDSRKVREPALAFCHDVFHHFHPGEECPDPEAMDESALREALRPRYPIHDVARSVTNAPLSKPIYLRRFKPDFIHDIAFGRLRVFACFDAEPFLRIGNEMGINIRWSTVKQAKRERSKKSGLFEVNGRYMIASDASGLEVSLGGGLFSQIIYDGMLPSSAMQMIPHMFDMRETGCGVPKCRPSPEG